MFFRGDCPNRWCLNLTSSKTQAKMTKTTTKQFDRVSISLQKKKLGVGFKYCLDFFTPKKFGEEFPCCIYMFQKGFEAPISYWSLQRCSGESPIKRYQVFDVTSEAPLPRCLRNNGRPVVSMKNVLWRRGSISDFIDFIGEYLEVMIRTRLYGMGYNWQL